MKTNFKKLAFDGVIASNPTLKLVLGTCPTLALTTLAMNGIGMGAAVTFVLVFSNILVSLLRKVIPSQVRIPAFVLIIATFVTIIRLALDYFLPDIYEALGLYLPLIVVNCIILARAESFASKNGVLASAADGLFMGIGFTLALTLMGAFRELLGSAAIFGIQLWDPAVFSIGFFASSAGAFFTYALFIAMFSLISAFIQKRNKIKAYNARLIVAENGAAAQAAATADDATTETTPTAATADNAKAATTEIVATTDSAKAATTETAEIADKKEDK